MHVNKIVNFGKIIRINSDGYSPDKNSRVDKSTYEICKILNSERSNKYSKENSAKIRAFFQSCLQEYNGKNGISIKKSNNGEIFLLSGRDAKVVEKLESKAKVEEALTKIDSYIERKLRQNKNLGIDDSLDFIEGHKTKSGFSTFNKFIFTKMRALPGKIQDGRIYQSDKEDANTVFSITCRQKVLDLNI